MHGVGHMFCGQLVLIGLLLAFPWLPRILLVAVALPSVWAIYSMCMWDRQQEVEQREGD